MYNFQVTFCFSLFFVYDAENLRQMSQLQNFQKYFISLPQNVFPMNSINSHEKHFSILLPVDKMKLWLCGLVLAFATFAHTETTSYDETSR